MKVVIENGWVGEIPVLCVAPADAMKRPLIFYIPGHGSNKESSLSIAYQLAQQGFFVVSFDAWMHGERFDERIFRAAEPEFGGVYPPETGLDVGAVFYQVIARCLDDVHTLLDYFAGDPRADVANCGVTGHSMGAYASFLVFAKLPQIKAAVPMMGVPSFDRRWQDILDECAYSNAAWAEAMAAQAKVTQRHSDFVRSLDPYPLLAAAAPRALLMMNGDFDCDQPKSYSIYAYRELKSAWAGASDKLKLNIYPVGHTVTSEMERDLSAWFAVHVERKNPA
ncbi:MAG: alpha/beta hydrolase [Caldilinea sp.]